MDDGRDEGGDWPVCDHRQERNKEDQPELDVGHQLDGLGFLEVRVADAGVVGTEAGDEDVALAFVEASCADGVWREEDKEKDAPEGGECWRVRCQCSAVGRSDWLEEPYILQRYTCTSMAKEQR